MPQTNLMELNDVQFRRLVDLDLRRKAEPAVAAALRSDSQIVDRWFFVLQSILLSTEGQLAGRKADQEAKEERARRLLSKPPRTDARKKIIRERLSIDRQEEARWRSRVLRFKSGVEEYLNEAERLREQFRAQDTTGVVALEKERNRAIHQLIVLQDAIRAHRDHICDERCDDECIADQALWDLVD